MGINPRARRQLPFDFPLGDPEFFKYPKESLYKLMKETFKMTDDDLRITQTTSALTKLTFLIIRLRLTRNTSKRSKKLSATILSRPKITAFGRCLRLHGL